jgi:hypothetical protein
MDRSYPYNRRLAQRARLRKPVLLLALFGTAVTALAFALFVDSDPIAGSLPQRLRAQVAPASLSATAPQPAAVVRRVYPYSVVPGGVTTQAQLARIVRSDKVVADHYASFDVAQARPVTLERARAVHVSYRKGDQVFWTAKKVMLPAGETLLTDGRSEVRTRCANRVSDVARFPIEAHGPSAELLDASYEQAFDDEPAAAPTLALADAREQGTAPTLATRLLPAQADLRTGQALFAGPWNGQPTGIAMPAAGLSAPQALRYGALATLAAPLTGKEPALPALPTVPVSAAPAASAPATATPVVPVSSNVDAALPATASGTASGTAPVTASVTAPNTAPVAAPVTVPVTAPVTTVASTAPPVVAPLPATVPVAGTTAPTAGVVAPAPAAIVSAPATPATPATPAPGPGTTNQAVVLPTPNANPGTGTAASPPVSAPGTPESILGVPPLPASVPGTDTPGRLASAADLPGLPGLPGLSGLPAQPEGPGLPTVGAGDLPATPPGQVAGTLLPPTVDPTPFIPQTDPGAPVRLVDASLDLPVPSDLPEPGSTWLVAAALAALLARRGAK